MKCIATQDDVFSGEECDALLAAFDELTYTPGTMTRNGKPGVYLDLRHNRFSYILKEDPLWPAVFRIHEAMANINTNVFKADITDTFRGEVVKYDAAEGEDFAWHYDDPLWYPRVPYRKLTGVIQVTDPDSYSGGDLQLRDLDETITVKRKRGMLAVFPSCTSHRVTPITRGIRHTLVTFGIGPMWR